MYAGDAYSPEPDPEPRMYWRDRQRPRCMDLESMLFCMHTVCILIEYDPMIITVWYWLVVGGVLLLLLGLHT